MKPSLAQLRRLVGNPDAYAKQSKDGSWTPFREPLTDVVLQHHLDEDCTVGTYVGHCLGTDSDAMGRQTVARTLVFDIDVDEANQADRICTALHDLGVGSNYLGVEFSGKKGYHVWLPLQDYRPSHELRRVGRAVLAMSGVTCEVFPKQDEVKDLGNLVKLPGGVHQVSGKQNDFLTAVPRPMPVGRWSTIFESLPPEQRARRTNSGESRFPCLEHIQEGVAEGGRNNSLFQLAAMFRLNGMTTETLALVLDHVAAKCDPPVEEHEVEAILDGSDSSGPLCTEDMRERCGDSCIGERTSGLQETARGLKNVAVGERVVMTLAERAGTSITLTHPDLSRPTKARVRAQTEDED